mmetsp:Transcript_66353/g.158580  ORF Transcript_66353/g.158580 Transcript_66353/m.158580 type:complete len:406 (+) Transcript_66353:859-2076(+)
MRVQLPEHRRDRGQRLGPAAQCPPRRLLVGRRLIILLIILLPVRRPLGGLFSGLSSLVHRQQLLPKLLPFLPFQGLNELHVRPLVIHLLVHLEANCVLVGLLRLRLIAAAPHLGIAFLLLRCFRHLHLRLLALVDHKTGVALLDPCRQPPNVVVEVAAAGGARLLVLLLDRPLHLAVGRVVGVVLVAPGKGTTRREGIVVGIKVAGARRPLRLTPSQLRGALELAGGLSLLQLVDLVEDFGVHAEEALLVVAKALEARGGEELKDVDPDRLLLALLPQPVAAAEDLIAMGVIPRALRRVRERHVRVRDLFEHLGGLLEAVVVLVGVPLERRFAVGGFDRIGVRVPLDPEDLVQAPPRRHPPRMFHTHAASFFRSMRPSSLPFVGGRVQSKPCTQPPPHNGGFSRV